MRVRNIPGAKELLQEYKNYVAELSIYKYRWNEYFSNKNPIHIEIGMGKGQFLTTLAQYNPTINYIGIEKTEELLLKALKTIDDLNINNIGLIHLNALNLREVFAKHEISRIYLNFSDPWPKERHSKRRLTHRGFLGMYKEILASGGEIHFKTDNLQLFEFSVEEMKYQNLELKEVIYDLHGNGIAEDNVMTEYEEKFVREHKPIYKCIAIVK